MLSWKYFHIICVWMQLFVWDTYAKGPSLQIITVATDGTDGFFRFMKSAKKFDHDVKVLGMGQKWEGGDIDRFPGGGQKILLLREAMEEYKDQKDLVVMFMDSYDVVLTAGPDKVLSTFKEFEARVLFSAEAFCWPDRSLHNKYPQVKTSEKRFLNSGGFMGYARDIYDLVHLGHVEKESDDQLYFTEIFLDVELRKKYSMQLDKRSEIFQCLNGALDEMDIKFKGDSTYAYNMVTGNTPIVLHGNGPILNEFNHLTNYVPDQWNPTAGCVTCNEDSISLEGLKEEDMPRVYMALFVEHPTAFLEEFFTGIGQQAYPKSKIDLFIHYADEHHASDVQAFMGKYGIKYNSAKLYAPSQDMQEWDARNKALEECVKLNCQYFFTVDSDVQLEFDHTISQLIERNRSVIAPAMNRPKKMWANFWGALNSEGFYKRSDDYANIVEGSRQGLWKVPYMSMCYLIHGYRIPSLLGGYDSSNLDADMAIAETIRNKGIFMWIDNQVAYGHLSNSDSYTTNHLHNDLYALYDNPEFWEKKYLHEEYANALLADYKIEQPCPDVFWMPMFSPTFCKHLIEEMEHNGEWSGGKHQDARLQGGYENVPTDDIHTTQIGWEKHWLTILKNYIVPLNAKLFKGYYSPAQATMNFVVKYRPDRQDRLRPHADSSTFTVNVALNTPNVDYEGGGVRFLRYECTVTALRLGWMLMHPGRLTHEHEGLPTTAGTRYIMVSFVDP